VSGHRAGVVALLGRPNAGKSTLLNRILGEKLAIVTSKPQTTRSRILGIHTLPGAQILFVDTPGLHAGGKALNAALNEQALAAADDCDAALLLLDPAGGLGADHRALLARLSARGTPVVVAATRADLPVPPPEWLPPDAPPVLRVSGRTGEGVDALVSALVERLPESPPLYPEDALSDRSLRWLAGEEVREAAFEVLAQELPYVLAVEVVDFDESRADLVRIRADLLVERESQKAIVIGRGGETIKRIGVRARPAIEARVGARVHLELRVKVEPRWARRPARLRELGYA
jgi:GTP-binding protein Era